MVENCVLPGAQKDPDCSCQTESCCLINRNEAMSMVDIV